MFEHKDHYIDIFESRNKEIINFFDDHDSNRLIHCALSDDDKWETLGEFFNIIVPKDFNVHSNKSLQKD
ncbi:hypothetical protein [Hyunsoonleella aestuarii]|uniref:Glycosyl hydrolase family 13 catalytic domain-containing protein n=1 Tax=Hyunsoonleella aestuarii TaxID=912802 RepID=A0ABP8E6Z0_9FLAO|nr:hypothetical protein [Hyunsoonleella aestuarii]